jgi:hypothetical protein
MSDFRQTDVTVMLTGEEWLALMAQLAGFNLTAEGQLILRRAQLKLGATIDGAWKLEQVRAFPSPSMVDLTRFEWT